MLRQSGISGDALYEVYNRGVVDTGHACSIAGLQGQGAGRANNPDPYPLLYGETFTLTTSTDWYRHNDPTPGKLQFVAGIEMGRKTYVSKGSFHSTGHGFSSCFYDTLGPDSPAVVSVMTDHDYWGRCQWRLEPTDATKKGKPVQIGDTFKVQYQGENNNLKGKYMQVGDDSDSYLNGSGFVDGVFTAKYGSSTMLNYTMPMFERQQTGNVIYLADEFRLIPVNGHKGKDWGWGMAIQKAYSNDEDDLPGHPQTGPFGSTETLWMVGNFGEMDHVPVHWGVSPKCNSSWSASNWDQTITDRFRAYPSTAPTSQPPPLPNSCKCNYVDPDGQQKSYRGQPHREWCARSKTFAQCVLAPTPADTSKKQWQWESCASVQTCRGEYAKNVCGPVPQNTECPGLTEFCCDTTTRTWRCRSHNLAAGISFSCPLPGSSGWGGSLPTGPCRNNTEQYTCMPTQAQTIEKKGGPMEVQGLNVQGSYSCSDAGLPVFLCP